MNQVINIPIEKIINTGMLLAIFAMGTFFIMSQTFG